MRVCWFDGRGAGRAQDPFLLFPSHWERRGTVSVLSGDYRRPSPPFTSTAPSPLFCADPNHLFPIIQSRNHHSFHCRPLTTPPSPTSALTPLSFPASDIPATCYLPQRPFDCWSSGSTVSFLCLVFCEDTLFLIRLMAGNVSGSIPFVVKSAFIFPTMADGKI